MCLATALHGGHDARSVGDPLGVDAARRRAAAAPIRTYDDAAATCCPARDSSRFRTPSISCSANGWIESLNVSF
jgi:hypothetical protein